MSVFVTCRSTLPPVLHFKIEILIVLRTLNLHAKHLHMQQKIFVLENKTLIFIYINFVSTLYSPAMQNRLISLCQEAAVEIVVQFYARYFA